MFNSSHIIYSIHHKMYCCTHMYAIMKYMYTCIILYLCYCRTTFLEIHNFVTTIVVGRTHRFYYMYVRIHIHIWCDVQKHVVYTRCPIKMTKCSTDNNRRSENREFPAKRSCVGDGETILAPMSVTGFLARNPRLLPYIGEPRQDNP